MRFFNLSNYKDPVYRNILLFCLCSFTAIGDVLLPLLNYQLLELPNINQNYINYTTLINIIPILPFIFSIILGIVANYFNYSNLLKISSILLILIFIILVSITNNLMIIIFATLFASLIFRIIYLALDSQIANILLSKIHDFQSDLFILSSIIGIICYKLSATIYSIFNNTGLITLFIILSIWSLYFASSIPAITPQQNKKLAQDKLVLNKVIKKNKLIQFLALVLIFSFISGCYNNYIMLILKKQQVTPIAFANINSISMFIGLIFALIPKRIYTTEQLYKILLISLYTIPTVIILIQINIHNLNIYYISINTLSSLNYIITNIIIFRLVGNDIQLKTNVPIFLGLWSTIICIDGAFSQIISNISLKYLINYHYLFAYILAFILFINTLYMHRKPPTT